jgi:hypothetical protein
MLFEEGMKKNGDKETTKHLFIAFDGVRLIHSHASCKANIN